jgi:hypothetical protein
MRKVRKKFLKKKIPARRKSKKAKNKRENGVGKRRLYLLAAPLALD